MRIFRLLVASALVLATTAQEDCKDLNEHCKAWATTGECDKNPGYMEKECQRSCGACLVDPELFTLGKERVILEVQIPGNTEIQEIELGFYPKAAPKTVSHVINLFLQGCYDTNHIFGLQKGFVAQIHGVHPGAVTTKPLSSICLDQAKKRIPGEFTAIPHKRGVLSMSRDDNDPDSGGSAFSMLLGDAPQLDNKYTVFGKVLAGDNVLAELEKVETRTEGVHVMPIERITIVEAYVVRVDSEDSGEEEEDDGGWGQEEEEL